MEHFIMNTSKWVDDIGKSYQNFDQYFNSNQFCLKDLYFDAYALFDDHLCVAKFREAGFDGAIHAGCGETFGEIEYKVFSEKQVWPLHCAHVNYEKLARQLSGSRRTKDSSGFIRSKARGFRRKSKILLIQ